MKPKISFDSNLQTAVSTGTIGTLVKNSESQSINSKGEEVLNLSFDDDELFLEIHRDINSDNYSEEWKKKVESKGNVHLIKFDL